MPGLRRVLSQVGLDGLVTLVKRSPVNGWIRKRLPRGRASIRGKIAEPTSKRLQGFYAEPNKELKELLEENAPAWCDF